jgi:hypothetical protein
MVVALGVPVGLCWSLMRRHDLATAERGLGATAALLSVVKSPSLPRSTDRVGFEEQESGSGGCSWSAGVDLEEFRARP